MHGQKKSKYQIPVKYSKEEYVNKRKMKTVETQHFIRIYCSDIRIQQPFSLLPFHRVHFFNTVVEVDITLTLNSHNVRIQRNDGEQFPSYVTLEFSQGDTNGNGAGNDCSIQPVHL
jgi:uncharacterized membrane protein